MCKLVFSMLRVFVFIILLLGKVSLIPRPIPSFLECNIESWGLNGPGDEA